MYRRGFVKGCAGVFMVAMLFAGMIEAAGGSTVVTGKRPEIDVCFVLDTTGSMSGLIEGAKAKIWSIANQMISAEPTPAIRIGLIGYRDRGDEYVTRVFDLSDDIDAVYANLSRFRADGGGDTPESVNQALREAVRAMRWNTRRDVLKIIFLVGDCPPHMDYRDDIPYSVTCQAAVKKDLIINTVQCGDHSETAPIWQEMAQLSEGSYVAIGQTGDMRVVATPMDARIAELNAELGTTLVPYGDESRREIVRAKQVASEAAPAAAAADRLAFNAKTGKAVQGGGDLVDDVTGGTVKLGDVKRDELPASLRDKSATELKGYLDQQSAKRRQIQGQINELLKQRQDYVTAETRKLEGTTKGSFDAKVTEILQEQAARKGIVYEKQSPRK